MFQIPKCSARYDTKEQLQEALAELPDFKNFTAIECSGNSYSLEACKYIAELIKDNASENLYLADFSDMFVSRKIDFMPESIKCLIDAVGDRPVKQVCLNSNAIGVRVVPSFE